MCHGTTNEFLHHLWILLQSDQPDDLQLSNMVTALGATRHRIESIAKTALPMGVPKNRIYDVFSYLLQTSLRR